MAISQENNQALKNPWVLGFLLFLCTFVTMNIIFIYLAFKSPPNLVVDDYYERGKAYAQKEMQNDQGNKLGWSGVIMLPKNNRVNQRQAYEVFIQGKNSAAIELDSVTLFAYRPSDMQEDFSVEMNPMGLGRYGSDIEFGVPGNWDIIVEAKRGEDEFVITRRIYIDP